MCFIFIFAISFFCLPIIVLLFTFEKRPHYVGETILIRLHLQELLACATVSPEMLWKPSSMFYIFMLFTSRNFVVAAILTQSLKPLMLCWL